MSRNPVQQAVFEDETETNEIPTFIIGSMNLNDLQRSDDRLNELINDLENPDDPNLTIGIKKRAKSFILDNGVLYKTNTSVVGNSILLAVPKNWRNFIFDS